MESEATWETLLLRNCEVWVYGEFMYAAQSPERERARGINTERERERETVKLLHLKLTLN